MTHSPTTHEEVCIFTHKEYKTFKGFRTAVTRAVNKIFGQIEDLENPCSPCKGETSGRICEDTEGKTVYEVLDREGSYYFNEYAGGDYPYKRGIDVDFDCGRIYVYSQESN